MLFRSGSPAAILHAGEVEFPTLPSTVLINAPQLPFEHELCKEWNVPAGPESQRVRVHSVAAESTLTKDTVPVSVDAIVFWLVWNAEKSILEVEDFAQAIDMSAHTALRESIGRHELAQMITEREMMGRELQRILDEKTNPWGITVQSVEIRDVRIPIGLQNAMSQQAQAERERQARVILGEAEVQVSAQFAQASQAYADNPVALHLRAMNMLYEAIRDKGATVIVPSSAVETMGLGGMLALTSMGKQQ